jgi:translation elongation factor EF-Ts
VDLPQVKELGKSLAMHVVAMNPPYTSRHAVDDETLSKELAIAAAAQVPIDRFFQAMCMDEQPFTLDYSTTVGAHISDVAKTVGCSIALGRIWRHSA